MSFIRLVFATIFIFAAFGYSFGEILSKDLKFDLFSGINASEYLAGLEKCLTPTTAKVEGGSAVNSGVNKLYRNIDYAGEAFRDIYDAEKFINQLVGKSDTGSKYLESDLNELRDALKKITEIENDIKILESDVWLLAPSDTEKASCLRAKLAEILAKFNTKSLSLQLYPTLSSPYLLQLASIAARLKSESDFPVFCTLAATIKQYFYSYLFNRLNQVEIDVHPNDYASENKYTHIRTVSSSRFNINPENIDSVRCKQIEDGESRYNSNREVIKRAKKGAKHLLVKDSMGTNGEYLIANQSECADDYMQLVRKSAEKKFAEAYNLVSEACKSDVQRSGK